MLFNIIYHFDKTTPTDKKSDFQAGSHIAIECCSNNTW